MIDYETFSRIKHLHERKGLRAAQIAREVGLDERTVRKHLKEQQFLPCKSVQRPSKLDPFKETVVRMVESYPYSAAQVLHRLKEEGFDGGCTAVKEFIRKVRPKREKAFLKLAFAPGECAQVDWGSYGTDGATRKRPADLLLEERPHLLPLPQHLYDAAAVSSVRVSSQFRVALDSNRYSVPARFAGRSLTMRTYPDRLCFYHEDQLVARHARSFERNRDFEDPDHPKELILQRKKARDQHLFKRFLALSNGSSDYERGSIIITSNRAYKQWPRLPGRLRPAHGRAWA